MRQQQKKKKTKLKTMSNDDIKKKTRQHNISIHVNFSNGDPSYQSRSTIHKKNMRVKTT